MLNYLSSIPWEKPSRLLFGCEFRVTKNVMEMYLAAMAFRPPGRGFVLEPIEGFPCAHRQDHLRMGLGPPYFSEKTEMKYIQV